MKKEPRMLIAVGEPVDPNGVKVVILGMTEATWEDIDGGKGQDVDLRPLGIPATLLLVRGKDHDDIKLRLLQVAQELDVPSSPLADLSVPPPKLN